jgi:hypothetical protein
MDGRSGSDMATAATLAHATRGRIRLLVAALRKDVEGMSALVDRLADTPAVARVRGRPATGSVVLDFDGEPDRIIEALSGSGVVTLTIPEPGEAVSFRDAARSGVAMADAEIRKQTNGMFDAGSALAAAFVVAAGAQLVRGRLFGPTTTLLLGAVSILSQTRAREE